MNNKAGAASISSKSTNLFWEFFFQLTQISPIPNAVFGLFWLLEKLILAAPLIMLILNDTSWDKGAVFARYFSVLSYFTGESGFAIFCYVFFGVVQAGTALIVYQVFAIRRGLAEGGNSKYSILGQVLHLYFVAASKVLLQLCTVLLGYCIQQFSIGDAFESYKQIASALVKPNAQGYVIVTLLSLSLAELIVVSLVNALFCQDRALRRKITWSPNTFYPDIVMAGLQVAVQVDFVFIHNGNSLVSFILLGLWLCYLGIMIWYTSWDSYLMDLAEFFYATFSVGIQGLDVLFNVLSLGSFADYYSYVLLIPLFSLQLCVVRRLVFTGLVTDQPKRDTEAIEMIKELVSLAQYKDKVAGTKLLLLLCSHSKECVKPECRCHELKSKLRLEEPKPLTENSKVYVVSNELPECYRRGFVCSTAKLLLGELEVQHGKSDEFCVTLAEAYFHFLGNHYFSLEQINTVSNRKPSVLLKQRIYNLRREIAIGIQDENEEEDPERTAAAIDYLKCYHKFLEQAEDNTELTLKFWSVLLKEAPTAQELNAIGKKLFDSKKEVMETVQNITKITSNHVEFLLRYGLLLKFVLQDSASTEQVFRKLLYLTQSAKYYGGATGFSLFRGDAKVMFLVGTIDSAFSGTVTEINNEFETIMGYHRNDLVGYSITNIMPPMIAKRHGEFVQKFFQTMESGTIGVPKLRFIKSKDGLYVSCKTLLKVVPRLTDGLQVALFAVEDSAVTHYAGYKRDQTGKKVGAIVCDEGFRLVGMTKEATSILRIPYESVKELVKNATLHDMFPQLENQVVSAEVSEKEGRVIAYLPHNLPFELDKEYDNGDLNAAPDKDARFKPDTAASTLIWIRLVTEEYGGGSEKATMLILSEIPPARQPRYAPVPDLEAIYEDRTEGDAMMPQIRGPKVRRKVPEKPLMIASPSPAEFSPAPSMESMGSVQSGSGTGTVTTATFEELANQLRMEEFSKKMPESIKKLFVGIVLILVGITVLIFVGMGIAVGETNALMERFELIKAYQARYKMNMVLGSMAGNYMTNLKKSKATFNLYLARIVGRGDMIAGYNDRTRKLLFSQHLDYDLENIIVPDLPAGERIVTFGHAELISMNAVVEYSSYGYYDSVSECVSGNSPKCSRIKDLLGMSYTMSLYSMREKQDNVVQRLQSELRLLATQGENTQYTITGICTGLVLISLIAIMPVFNWVIKDKSYVLAIFSDIAVPEIRKVIEECQKMDLRNVKYKQQWVERFESNQGAFWDKLMAEHKKGFGKKDKHKPTIVKEVTGFDEVKDVIFKKVGAVIAAAGSEPHENAKEDAENPKESHEDQEEDGERQGADQSVVEGLSVKLAEAANKRRELLSELESVFYIF